MQFSQLPEDNFIPLSMAYDWLAQELYIVGTVGGVFKIWSIVDMDGLGGAMSLIHNRSTIAEVVQAQISINPFSG